MQVHESRLGSGTLGFDTLMLSRLKELTALEFFNLHDFAGKHGKNHAGDNAGHAMSGSQ